MTEFKIGNSSFFVHSTEDIQSRSLISRMAEKKIGQSSFFVHAFIDRLSNFTFATGKTNYLLGRVVATTVYEMCTCETLERSSLDG